MWKRKEDCVGGTCVCHRLFVPPCQQGIHPHHLKPLHMALNRAQVTAVTEAKEDSHHPFFGIANGPGYKKREFEYSYRRVVDVKVGTRRLTANETAALVKSINESRRAKRALQAAKDADCQHKGGKPITWKPGMGGGDTPSPPSNPKASSPQRSAKKRRKSQPADDSGDSGATAKSAPKPKPTAASPDAENGAAILDSLVAPFAMVPAARRARPGRWYRLHEDADEEAGARAWARPRPTFGDGMSQKGNFRSPAAPAAAAAVTAPQMEAAGALLAMDDAATAAAAAAPNQRWKGKGSAAAAAAPAPASAAATATAAASRSPPVRRHLRGPHPCAVRAHQGGRSSSACSHMR